MCSVIWSYVRVLFRQRWALCRVLWYFGNIGNVVTFESVVVAVVAAESVFLFLGFGCIVGLNEWYHC